VIDTSQPTIVPCGASGQGPPSGQRRDGAHSRNTDATPGVHFPFAGRNAATWPTKCAWLIASVRGLAAPCSAWTKTVAAFTGCGGLFSARDIEAASVQGATEAVLTWAATSGGFCRPSGRYFPPRIESLSARYRTLLADFPRTSGFTKKPLPRPGYGFFYARTGKPRKSPRRHPPPSPRPRHRPLVSATGGLHCFLPHRRALRR
jgi:hypothetical protein